MTDIITRLRDFRRWNQAHQQYDPVPLTQEAADKMASLHSALRGATDYLECLDKAHPDLAVSIHGLFPIKEMVERYRAALIHQQTARAAGDDPRQEGE